MDRRQYLLLVVSAFLAGLVGGVVSGWIFIAAWQPEQQDRVITAEEFRLVDEEGSVMVRTGIDVIRGQPSLLPFDKTGRVIWRALY